MYGTISPNVTKWFDKPCDMVDKGWIGAQQHTIKPVDLRGNIKNHLPPDVWPDNTQPNKGNKQKHTHTHKPKPALTPFHLHFFLHLLLEHDLEVLENCLLKHAHLTLWLQQVPLLFSFTYILTKQAGYREAGSYNMKLRNG